MWAEVPGSFTNPNFSEHIVFSVESITAKSMSSGYPFESLYVGGGCTFENKNICETVSTLNSN